MSAAYVNVVAVSLKEAQMLAADGLHHGSIDEANATLREIRRTADHFYASQYRVFSVRAARDDNREMSKQ